MISDHDPIVWMLFGGTIFFTFVLIGVAYFFKTDGQTFQVVAGLLTGFAGALLTRIKPPSKPEAPPNAPPQTILTPPTNGTA